MKAQRSRSPEEDVAECSLDMNKTLFLDPPSLLMAEKRSDIHLRGNRASELFRDEGEESVFFLNEESSPYVLSVFSYCLLLWPKNLNGIYKITEAITFEGDVFLCFSYLILWLAIIGMAFVWDYVIQSSRTGQYDRNRLNLYCTLHDPTLSLNPGHGTKSKDVALVVSSSILKFKNYSLLVYFTYKSLYSQV